MPITPDEQFTAMLDRLTAMEGADQLEALTERYERRSSRNARLLQPWIADLANVEVGNRTTTP